MVGPSPSNFKITLSSSLNSIGQIILTRKFLVCLHWRLLRLPYPGRQLSNRQCLQDSVSRRSWKNLTKIDLFPPPQRWERAFARLEEQGEYPPNCVRQKPRFAMFKAYLHTLIFLFYFSFRFPFYDTGPLGTNERRVFIKFFAIKMQWDLRGAPVAIQRRCCNEFQ